MANPNRFNEDLTGENYNNRVVDEPHALPIKNYRSIAPIYGPYYTESLVITDETGTQLLTRDIDYKCLDVVGIPTAKSGKEICTIIVITNLEVPTNVLITYQALGGDYEHTHEAIKLLVDNLLADTRPISWPNILNRPDTFEPSHHLHQVGDIYGFEYLVVELERLKNAILLGDEIAHMEILSYIDSNIGILRSFVENTDNLVSLMGVTAATDAKTSATAALVVIDTVTSNMDSVQTNVNNAMLSLDTLNADAQISENQAIALIQNYS